MCVCVQVEQEGRGWCVKVELDGGCRSWPKAEATFAAAAKSHFRLIFVSL
jgi:hypothetical protein